MKDFKKILGREVDEQNRTIYVIENVDGIEERVLYSEIDQKRVARESKKEQYFATVIKKSSGERMVIKSHDEHGNKSDADIELERDKFIHPRKYEKEV